MWPKLFVLDVSDISCCSCLYSCSSDIGHCCALVVRQLYSDHSHSLLCSACAISCCSCMAVVVTSAAVVCHIVLVT